MNFELRKANDIHQGSFINGQEWHGLLQTAVNQGWKPAGTMRLRFAQSATPQRLPNGTVQYSYEPAIAMVEQGTREPFPDGYLMAGGSVRITAEDALALAQAWRSTEDATLAGWIQLFELGAVDIA